jgi:hypothetical protein
MRTAPLSRRARLLTAGTLLAAASLVTAAVPAEAAGGTPATLTLDNLSLVITSQTVTGTAADGSPGKGTNSLYNITIYDSAGNAVGTMKGDDYIYKVDDTGEFLAYEADVVNIAGGTFVDYGPIDVQAAWHNVKQSLTAVGTGGALRGYRGTLRYTALVPTLAPYIWQADADVSLGKG